MLQIFNWPRTIDSKLGTLRVTGWHQTPGLRKLGLFLTSMTGVAMMVNPFFGAYSIVNRTVVDLISFFEPQWPLKEIAGLWLIAEFFIGCLIAALASDKKLNLYALIVRRQTTVKISSDAIEIHGVRYPRDAAANIHFTNRLPPQAVKLEDREGQSVIMGSMEDGNTLRMAYGGNTVIVTTFLKTEHAGLFALACNAALYLPIEQVRGFEVVTPVQEISEDDNALFAPARALAVRRARRQ